MDFSEAYLTAGISSSLVETKSERWNALSGIPKLSSTFSIIVTWI